MKEKDWLNNPDTIAKVVVAVLLVALFGLIHFFAQDFFTNTFKLAVSGNVNGLVEYLRSFGPWAMVVSFFLDVLINAGSIFPSIFLSTANGLIFGLPLSILLFIPVKSLTNLFMYSPQATREEKISPIFPFSILVASSGVSRSVEISLIQIKFLPIRVNRWFAAGTPYTTAIWKINI